MSLDEQARKGDEAAIVTDMPIVREALEAIRKEIIEHLWSTTPARDTEGREWIWRHYKVLEKFEGLMRGYMEAGKLARIKMNENESFTDSIRRRFA